jgi:myo-inositol 2-dehydrogenase/D-chiro-inositol 1-dehydrogenase
MAHTPSRQRPVAAPGRITRRTFSAVGSLVGAAAAWTDPIANSAHAAGSDRIRVGLVGCGGRGTAAAMQAMAADRGNVLWAVADAFPDAVEGGAKLLERTVQERAQEDASFAERIDCPPERRFSGLDGFLGVIDCVDAVLLGSPPAFRPRHLRAAVEAGKHVFCEKPVAVDATTLRHVRDSVQMARERGLSLVSGFCWRYANRMRDAFRRLADGAIGPVRSAYTTYLATGYRGEVPRQPGWTDMEYQIRNWHYYTWLSGDHITEQAIHSLDRLLWAFGDEMPVAVSCTGGRERRGPEPLGNNIFDHFAAAFSFADGRRGFHTTRHFPGAGTDQTDYITGATGTAEIHGFKNLQRFETATGRWNSSAERNDMYQSEHDELFASIRAGRPIDDGSVLVNANALALMARMSGYTGQPVTLEQFWASAEDLLPDPLSLDAPVPPTPIAVPGQTKLV